MTPDRTVEPDVPAAYFLYIGHFQIAPEERALTALFGHEYTAYVSKVRRWL